MDEYLPVLQNATDADLTNHNSPLAGVRAKAYDLVINGYECGGGSIRIHHPEVQSALFRAVRGNDLAEARRINERIYPLARVFYSEPWSDMHNRMKEALVLLGRQKRAVVRPPLAKLGDAEIERIRQALLDSGLLRREPGRDAA